MILVKKFFKVDVNKEIAEVEDDKKASLMAPHRATYRVTNELVQGLDIRKLHTLISMDFVVSRIERPDGTCVIPKANDKIELGDLVLIICSIQDEEVFNRFLGPKVDKQWEMNSGPIVSRRIIVTKTEYNGARPWTLPAWIFLPLPTSVFRWATGSRWWASLRISIQLQPSLATP